MANIYYEAGIMPFNLHRTYYSYIVIPLQEIRNKENLQENRC